jgi:hypothetical protein
MQTVALVRRPASLRSAAARLPDPVHRSAAKIKKWFDSLASLPYISPTDGAAALSGR